MGEFVALGTLIAYLFLLALRLASRDVEEYQHTRNRVFHKGFPWVALFACAFALTRFFSVVLPWSESFWGLIWAAVLFSFGPLLAFFILIRVVWELVDSMGHGEA